jgi:hypothetical protein
MISTEHVRAVYSIGSHKLTDEQELARDKAFVDWLEEHDRQVAERAWAQGLAAMVHYQQGAVRKVPYPVNPHKEDAS